MNKKLMFLTLVLFLVIAITGCATEKKNTSKNKIIPNSVKSGENALKLVIQPCWDPEESYEMFKPMADFLTEKTGQEIKLVIPDSEEDFNLIMESESVLALQGSFSAYVQNLNNNLKSKPLVLTVSENGETEEQATFLVKADSDIKNLNDLKGKTFLFGAKDNSPKFFATYVTLKKAGINVEDDLKSFDFGGECSDNSMAVFLGEYDAGVACKDYVEGKEGQDTFDFKTDLKPIFDSIAVPSTMLTVSESINADLVEKISSAMEELAPESESSEEVLAKTEWSGFQKVTGNELAEIGELVEEYSVPTK